jgi:hypothetical protein
METLLTPFFGQTHAPDEGVCVVTEQNSRDRTGF